MSRAVDDTGNVETLSPSVNVNVGCPCTMAGPNVTPAVIDEQDAGAVEVGVRFKADVDGSVTGVRFYKASANTGTHVGNLWTTGGTLLGHRDVQRRDRFGLAAAELHHPGGHHGRDDLRRLVLRAARPLLGVERVLLLAEPGRRELARQPAAARRQCQQRRRQRRLHLRELVDLPDVDLRRRELRGRRRLHAEASAGCGQQRHGDARSRLGDRQLHGAVDRRAARRATSSRRSSARPRSPRSP